jgi:hypothetical protein
MRRRSANSAIWCKYPTPYVAQTNAVPANFWMREGTSRLGDHPFRNRTETPRETRDGDSKRIHYLEVGYRIIGPGFPKAMPRNRAVKITGSIICVAITRSWGDTIQSEFLWFIYQWVTGA